MHYLHEIGSNFIVVAVFIVLIALIVQNDKGDK